MVNVHVLQNSGMSTTTEPAFKNEKGKYINTLNHCSTQAYQALGCWIDEKHRCLVEKDIKKEDSVKFFLWLSCFKTSLVAQITLNNIQVY